MSNNMEFIVIFLGIIISAGLIATAISIATSYKRVIKVYRYKTSTDYKRIYDLLKQGAIVISLEYDYHSDGTLWHIWPHECRLYELDGTDRIDVPGDTLYNVTEKSFIGYCAYKNLEFLDFVEDYNKNKIDLVIDK